MEFLLLYGTAATTLLAGVVKLFGFDAVLGFGVGLWPYGYYHYPAVHYHRSNEKWALAHHPRLFLTKEQSDLFATAVLAILYVTKMSSIEFLLGFSVGLWGYGPFYYDSSRHTGAWQSAVVRNWEGWKYLKHWFSHGIVQIGERPEATERLLYTGFPHGIWPLSTGFVFVVQDFITRRFVKDAPTYVATARIVFWMPILREVFLAFGCVTTDWSTVQSLLHAGHNVVLLPEGIRGMGIPIDDSIDERFLVRAYEDKTITLVPVYNHNENEICMTWKNEWPSITALRRRSAKRCRYPFPTFHLGPWPWRKLTTFIGPPHRHCQETLEQYCARFWDSYTAFREEARTQCILRDYVRTEPDHHGCVVR